MASHPIIEAFGCWHRGRLLQCVMGVQSPYVGTPGGLGDTPRLSSTQTQTYGPYITVRQVATGVFVGAEPVLSQPKEHPLREDDLNVIFIRVPLHRE